MTSRELITELWDGIETFDEASADQALLALLWADPLAEALPRVVIPFLAQVGQRWEDGTLSVAHEHFATNLLRRRLSALTHHHDALDANGRRRPLALLACPPRERHDLVLLCFSLLLGEAGWRTLFLGADTPIAAVSVAAGAADVDVVVLAATRATALTAQTRAVVKLAEQHSVFIAGRGASGEVAQTLGAVLLPNDPIKALAELQRHERDSQR